MNVVDRSTSWVLLTLFGAKIVNIVFANAAFFNPYSFFTGDAIEFSRPFSARTILALLGKTISKIFFDQKIFFSGSEDQIVDDFDDFGRFGLEKASALSVWMFCMLYMVVKSIKCVKDDHTKAQRSRSSLLKYSKVHFH